MGPCTVSRDGVLNDINILERGAHLDCNKVQNAGNYNSRGEEMIIIGDIEKEAAGINANLSYLTDNLSGLVDREGDKKLLYEGEDHSESERSDFGDESQSIADLALLTGLALLERVPDLYLSAMTVDPLLLWNIRGAGGRMTLGPYIEDFNDFIAGNELVDGGFNGSKYTWCNNQQGTNRIWARLDRVLTNSSWVQAFPPISIHHQACICSDHSLLVVSLHHQIRRGPSPFRFQRMWVTHATYDSLLKDHWNLEVVGRPLHVLVTKLKIFRYKLKSWNSQIFGNVHQILHTLEDKILVAEAALEGSWQDDIGIELNRYKALHKQAVLQESIFYKQKSGVRWLDEGDDNTKFFHMVAKVRRSRNLISGLFLPNGAWTEDLGLLHKEAIDYYAGILSSEGCLIQEDMLGQKINVDKSSFMMHSGTPSLLIQSISNITGYQRKSTVMTYLGAPIYEGRAKIGYFDALLTKFRNKFAGWKANFLTQGGKLVMGSHDGKPKHNWVSWKAICRPVLEGGLGVRYIEDVVSSFRLKSLWNGLEKKSIWAFFIIDVLVKNSAWKIGNGDMNFWFENWSNEGILADTLIENETYSSVTLKEAVEAEFCIHGLTES
ncbi:hypothetical protein BVC80_637g5 [Macleaya cordata]|uniref:Endonuclease/exonuclease/phosphatase n=1 Tax=Macleaya cordata TaxID=56857 RepID=A0A200QMV4_MACCD|nr:hypothetical protein BVC80_637g5 [Macleaya cordata]